MNCQKCNNYGCPDKKFARYQRSQNVELQFNIHKASSRPVETIKVWPLENSELLLLEPVLSAIRATFKLSKSESLTETIILPKLKLQFVNTSNLLISFTKGEWELQIKEGADLHSIFSTNAKFIAQTFMPYRNEQQRSQEVNTCLSVRQIIREAYGYTLTQMIPMPVKESVAFFPARKCEKHTTKKSLLTNIAGNRVPKGCVMEWVQARFFLTD